MRNFEEGERWSPARLLRFLRERRSPGSGRILWPPQPRKCLRIDGREEEEEEEEDDDRGVHEISVRV